MTPADFKGPLLSYSPAPVREEPPVLSGRSGVARFPLLRLACLFSTFYCAAIVAIPAVLEYVR